MTALTADRETEFDVDQIRSYPVAAATEIFFGSIVCVNAGGFAIPGTDTAGISFVGIAAENADNNLGANGDIRVMVRKNGAHRLIADTTVLITQVGTEFFVVDDQTVDIAANVTNNVLVGRMAQFDADNVLEVVVALVPVTGPIS